MKAETKFGQFFKKALFCFFMCLIFAKLNSMQNLSDLDQINSSLEKPRLSFIALEKGITNLERMAFQLNQEIASLKQQLNDLKCALNQGASAGPKTTGSKDLPVNAVIAVSSKISTTGDVIQPVVQLQRGAVPTIAAPKPEANENIG